MKVLLALFLSLAVSVPALASAATATIAWTPPSAASDGLPLTGIKSITSYEVWVGTSPIPDNTTTPPIATVTGSTPGTTITQTVTVSPGDTVYARVKACNPGGCGPFSAQGSRTVPVPVPGAPTSVTITLQLAP